MAQVFNVVIADDEPLVLQFLRHCVKEAGHVVAGEAASGEELVQLSMTTKPDLIITDIQMPGIDGLEAARLIQEEFETPVIVLSAHCAPKFVEKANVSGVFAYLVKPVQMSCLLAAIPLAISRFQERQSQRQEISNVRKALEDRKTIERAKGIVMSRLEIDEQTAYQHLQKLARRNQKLLIDVANSILLSEEALSI